MLRVQASRIMERLAFDERYDAHDASLFRNTAHCRPLFCTILWHVAILPTLSSVTRNCLSLVTDAFMEIRVNPLQLNKCFLVPVKFSALILNVHCNFIITYRHIFFTNCGISPHCVRYRESGHSLELCCKNVKSVFEPKGMPH